MSLRTRDAATALFIVMEAIAWYMVLLALGTAMAREGYDVLVDRLRRGIIGTEERYRFAVATAEDAVQHATGGPPFIAVLIAAIGAFVLVRWMMRQRLALPLAAVLGVTVSLLAFHVLLHIAVARDLRVWESSPVIALTAPDASDLVNSVDLPGFVANPDTSGVTRESGAVTTLGLALVWLRFLFAGRAIVTYERVMRSFGVGFGIAVAIAIFTNITHNVDVLPQLLMYFIVGVLTLAVAHATRSQSEYESLRKSTPWIASLMVTLSAVTSLALLFGLLAFMDAGRLFSPVVGFVVDVVARAAYLILYPFAVVMEWIFNLILGGTVLDVDRMARNLREAEPPPGEGEGPKVPPWLTTAFRSLVLIVTAWLLYRIGKMVFAAKRRTETREQYIEVRGSAEGLAPGVPNLLRRFFRRGPDDDAAGAWLRRHAIYQLFARVVLSAQARGMRRAPGDTPLEFAHGAARRFDAPAFEPIAHAFDSARYGRHFPERDDVEALEQAYAEWERSHPLGGEQQPAR
jgi:hypothetical protein